MEPSRTCTQAGLQAGADLDAGYLSRTLRELVSASPVVGFGRILSRHGVLALIVAAAQLAMRQAIERSIGVDRCANSAYRTAAQQPLRGSLAQNSLESQR